MINEHMILPASDPFNHGIPDARYICLDYFTWVDSHKGIGLIADMMSAKMHQLKFKHHEAVSLDGHRWLITDAETAGWFVLKYGHIIAGIFTQAEIEVIMEKIPENISMHRSQLASVDIGAILTVIVKQANENIIPKS